MPVLLGLIVSAVWLKGVAMLLSKRQVGYTVARVATDLRLGLLRALLAARWSTFTRQPAGQVANAMATEADRASHAFSYLALIATYAIEASAYTAVALAISWRATLAAAGAAAVTLLLLSFLVRISMRAGQKQTVLLKSLLGRLTDGLGAVKLLKATGREEAVGPLLARETQRLNRQLQKRVLAREALRALQEPLLMTMLGAGLFVALVWLAMPLSSLFVMLLVFTRTLTRINSIQSKLQVLRTEESALWSIVDTIEAAEAAREPEGGGRAPSLDRGIALRDVRVAHDARAVLDGVDLECAAGEITAIVGASGSGKTTLTDLVTGLVAADAGEVLVDGTPLAELDLRAWRQGIGYVPQEMLLLNESVRTNVTFGDERLGDAEVEAALRDAGAWDFVATLPEGLDAPCGERGALFSGGQRQRIAIARALVHRPRLLILDEATAALDDASEAAVWSTVAALRGRTTVIAISHQPALTRIADRVYRLEGGRATRQAPTPRAVA